MFPSYIVILLIEILILAFSASVHEMAHAFAAYAFGDTTAKEQGRLTLNPLKHIDPFGSVILPFIMVVLHMPVFAFAKPVPYNPARLKNRRVGEICVALAGPFSNLVQIAFGFLLIKLFGTHANFLLMLILDQYIQMNCILFLFNMLPLPPLDGATAISALLPEKARICYAKIQPYALFVLLLIAFLLPSIFGIDVLGKYIQWGSDLLVFSIGHLFGF